MRPACASLRRRAAHRQRGADAGGPRPLVARASRGSTTRRRARPSRWTAEDLLFLMYTSGTTAKPKGIAHTTGGYLVGVATTHHYVFDLKPRAGRLLVRGRRRLDHRPQLHRLRAALQRRDVACMYEGTPDFPDKDRWWEIVERYGVDDPLHGADGDPPHMKWGPEHAQGTTCRRCGCSARSASRSTRRRGSGTTSTSAAGAARSSTRGGRRRRG